MASQYDEQGNLKPVDPWLTGSSEPSEARANRRAKAAKEKLSPVTPEPSRMPPILWHSQVIWVAFFSVYGVNKSRFAAINPLDDGRWAVLGIETDAQPSDDPIAGIQEVLASHAHKHLGIRKTMALAKKLAETFLHELCKEAECEHLITCGCKTVKKRRNIGKILVTRVESELDAELRTSESTDVKERLSPCPKSIRIESRPSRPKTRRAPCPPHTAK